MAQIKANGLKIEVEDYGEASNPAVLLIMGLAAQLTQWPPAFIDALVGQGYRVIAFDNRDIGLSEKLHAKRALKPMTYMALARFLGVKGLAPYSLVDMANDAAGVLDALSIDRAHIIGVSMGGMIGQILSANNPGRINSFTAVMSSTNNPNLPKANPEVIKKVFTVRQRPRTRDELIDNSVKLWRTIGTPDGGHDPAAFRERIAASVDRCTYPAGVRRQIAAIISTGDLRRWARRIETPTLVIHGSLDPLAPFQGGLDIAATVKDARAEIIDGMGHDLPPKFLPKITRLVVDHLRSAEEIAASARAA